MTIFRNTLAAFLAGGAALAGAASGQTPASPSDQAQVAARVEAIFSQRCKQCHDPASEGIPDREALSTFGTAFIFDTLKKGEMQPMAQGLSDDELTAVATFLTAQR